MNQHPGSKQSTAPRPLKRGGATNVEEQAASKLIEGYPLPPADDLTVQRIWHRVASAPELRASASRLGLSGLLAPSLAVCFAIALVAVLLRDRARPATHAVPVVSSAPAAELAAAQGGVFFSRPAERWQPGEEGQALAEGQSVRTDASGKALLDVFGIASILISRGTDLAIERLNGGTFLRLSQGSVVARVSKRPPSEPFFILTHRFSVKVVGTLFQVDQDASDRTVVSVREGVVEVTGADGRSWRLGAGQRWSSASPEQIGASAIAEPVKTLLEDGLRRANPTDLDRELGAVNGPVSPENSERTSLTGAPPPLSSLASGGGQGGGVRLTSVPPPSSSPAGGGGQVGGRFPSETAEAPRLSPPPVLLAMREAPPAPESAPIAAPTSAPVAATYADGVALERAGEIQAAAEGFTRAEKSDPEHAELALYALGRLKQHRLHDSQGALEAFETYRSKYPSGPLMPEVDLAVLEIEVAAGHRDQALAESVRFLASHPASERTVEVHLLRGDLLRERGDCRLALDEYRQVAAAPFAEDALFESAYCQRKLGDSSTARESLRQYQQRYPTGAHRDDVAKALRE